MKIVSCLVVRKTREIGENDMRLARRTSMAFWMDESCAYDREAAMSACPSQLPTIIMRLPSS